MTTWREQEIEKAKAKIMLASAQLRRQMHHEEREARPSNLA